MPKVAIYNIEGKKTGEMDLHPDIFGVKIDKALIHRAVVTQASNMRNTVAKTRDRSEVRGGGAKPWRQKGTGRARHGSIRSPLWRGGGVTFGPQPERNFKRKINKKEKRKALLMALSSKVAESLLILVENLKLKKIKTRDLIEILKKLRVFGKSTLILLTKPDEILFKSAANIPNVKVMLLSALNMIDLLTYDFLLMPKETIKDIEKVYK